MTQQPVLRFIERYLLNRDHGEDVGDAQTGGSLLRPARLEGVLCGKQGVAGRTCGKDLAHVVGSPAPGVTSPYGQLLEQVVGAELCLQCLVGRETAVVAGTGNTQTASQPAQGGTGAWP